MNRSAAGSLDLNVPWSIGEAAYYEIASRLRALSPSTIVEFGGGVSTIRLGLDFPRAKIVSIEHDPNFHAATRALKKEFAVNNVVLQCWPLHYTIKHRRIFQTYKVDPGSLPRRIDAALIDGPPYFVFLGREACLHIVHDSLAMGGLIFLDDHHRIHEQRAVQNYLSTYPGSYRSTEINVGHGLCVLEKVRQAPARTTLVSQLSNYRSALAHSVRRITQ